MVLGYKWMSQELTSELYLPWIIGVWKSTRSIAAGFDYETIGKHKYESEREWQNSILEKLIKESTEKEDNR